jgi:CubicO group peptidase (beta-lactamase class C family)
VIAHGKPGDGNARPLDGDTIFEIGSIGKVFTALLLADMARRGEVALDDPVAKYLPGIRMPERDGRAITLEHLATHTSGLPRLPTNFAPRDPSNPYADYSVAQLYEFLSGYELTREAGSHYQYSNLGAGLLGHVLARRAGTDYGTLVASRIAGPLGMYGTRMTVPASLLARAATGHDELLRPVANWTDTTLAGAGSLQSSVDDLLKFLAANLHPKNSPLSSALTAMLAVRKPTGAPGVDIALGWHVSRRNGSDFVWHNGGTGGYASFIGYSPQAGVGVVVLSNAAVDVDDIALRVIDGRQVQATLPHGESPPRRIE